MMANTKSNWGDWSTSKAGKKAKREARDVRRARFYLWFQNLKASIGCRLTPCEDNDPNGLQYYHIAGTVRTLTVDRMVHLTYSQARINAEREKCRLLCRKCFLKLNKEHPNYLMPEPPKRVGRVPKKTKTKPWFKHEPSTKVTLAANTTSRVVVDVDYTPAPKPPRPAFVIASPGGVPKKLTSVERKNYMLLIRKDLEALIELKQTEEYQLRARTFNV